MKQSDIKVGKTYRNRGKGTTTRKVSWIGLRDDGGPPWDTKFTGPWVRYHYAPGSTAWTLLSDFAHWAGSEVIDDE